MNQDAAALTEMELSSFHSSFIGTAPEPNAALNLAGLMDGGIIGGQRI